MTDIADIDFKWDRYPASANIVTRLGKFAYWRGLDLYLRASGRGRYLFLVCPARSGSSVTLHLLSSNPAIEGIGESHVSYHDTSDLRMMALRSIWNAKSFRVKGRYFLDKLVFDHHVIAPEIQRHPSVRFVFLTRDPLDNISSIKKAWPDSSDETVDSYLADRLEQMVAYAEALGDRSRSFFLSYEELTSGDAESTLAALQAWLGLDEPFSTEYGLIKGHGYGEFGRGDYSENLKGGRLLSAKEKASERLDLDAEPFARSIQTHADTVERLEQLSTTVRSTAGTTR